MLKIVVAGLLTLIYYSALCGQHFVSTANPQVDWHNLWGKESYSDVEVACILWGWFAYQILTEILQVLQFPEQMTSAGCSICLECPVAYFRGVSGRCLLELVGYFFCVAFFKLLPLENIIFKSKKEYLQWKLHNHRVQQLCLIISQYWYEANSRCISGVWFGKKGAGVFDNSWQLKK